MLQPGMPFWRDLCRVEVMLPDNVSDHRLGDRAVLKYLGKVDPTVTTCTTWVS